MSSQQKTNLTDAQIKECTRTRLLDAAFEDIYQNGFQGLRIDRLVLTTRLTKGAFYHHFASKTALGLAVIDERIAPMAKAVWCQHLANQDDPGDGIISCIEAMMGALGAKCFTYGCPINNLAQEMSPIDDIYRLRIKQIFDDIINCITGAISKGIADGIFQKDVNAANAATFILASIEGSIGLSKNAQDADIFTATMPELRRYIGSLRV